MNNEKRWERLARYFAGELSSEEEEKMEHWIQTDPDREQEIQRLYEIWKQAGHLPYRVNVDESWLKLSKQMDALEHAQQPMVGQRPVHVSTQDDRPGVAWRRAALVAATILIVTMAGFFSVYTHTPGDIADTSAVENQMFVTKNGERATYILSDGSKVMLHAGSRLEIPEDYNRSDRELYLEGEAYFEVTHNKDKPFIVQSGQTYTRVLGTRFLIQAWPEAGARVEVVVSEGKVAFAGSREGMSNSAHEVFITRNEMGSFTEGQQQPVVSQVADLTWYMGWTEGRLEFENRPVQEVLYRLERWYNIDIRVEDEQIRHRKITAEIDYSQPMSEVLQGIALTLELEMDKADRTYTFRAPEE